MDLVERIYQWANRKRHEKTLLRWGQTRQCPWCRQCVEQGGNHTMEMCSECQMFDTYTCGNCGGKSAWEFGPVPIFRLLISPPVPSTDAVNSDANIRRHIKKLKQTE